MSRPHDDHVAGILDALTRARARAHQLSLGTSGVLDVLVFDLDIAVGRAQALTANPGADNVSELVRDLARALDLTLDGQCAQQREIVEELTRARTLADDLVVAAAGTAEAAVPGPDAADDTTRMAQISAVIINIAVRTLPAQHQPRYLEEFRAELGELGEQSRRAQLSYALRQLAHHRRLRRELIDGQSAEDESGEGTMTPRLNQRPQAPQSQEVLEEDDDTDTGGEAGRCTWHAVLGTIERVLDSSARTRRARQLLDRVLAAAVLAVVGVAMIVAVADPWMPFAVLGLAGVSGAIEAIRWLHRRPRSNGR